MWLLTEIIRANRIATTPLRIVRQDGRKIDGDVSSAKMYFWNAGRLSIKKENVLKELTISLDDDNGEILDYQIDSVSRPVVEASLVRSEKEPKRDLSLNFKILEEDDVVAIQVIFTGNPKAEFLMNGNIEGVTSPIGIGPIQGTLFWQAYFEKVKGFFIFVLIITGLAILLQIPNGIKYIFSKINLNLNPNFSNKLNTIKTTMGLTFVIITIIWFVLVKPVLDSRNEKCLSG